MKVDKAKWQKKTLGEIGNIITGTTPSTKDINNYESNDVCFFKPGDLKENIINNLQTSSDFLSYYGYENSRKLPVGAILFSCIGIIGKIGILAMPASCNQQINAIICNPIYNNRFIAYNLLFCKNAFSEKANGPVVPLINKTNFSKFTIKVPNNISEQKAIAKELDAIQAMIDGYREQLADLDALAQSIFLETFGDISVNDCGWETTFISKLGTLKNGLNYSHLENGIPIKILGVGDFRHNLIFEDFSILTPISIKEKVPVEYLLRNDDIVFVRSNGNKDLVGRCMRVLPNDENVSFSGFCIRFRKTSESILIAYLLYLLSDRTFKKTHILKTKGIGIQNVNQKILGNLPIPIPPLSLQQQFATQVEAIEKQKELLRQQLADAETLMAERMQYYFAEISESSEISENSEFSDNSDNNIK